MEKAKKIYSSLEQACIEGNIGSVEEYIQELENLSSENDIVIEIYSKAIAKALETFQGKFKSSKVKKYISTVENFVKKNPKNENLQTNYAKALRSSLLAMQAKGQPNVMRNIMSSFDDLASVYPDNILIHEELSSASHEIVNYWRSRGDFKALRERTQKFRELVKKFPNNEKIKLNLSKSIILEIGSSRKSDIAKIDNLLQEIQVISESMPTNVGLQLEWVHAYREAMDRSYEKPEDAKRWLEDMKKIAKDKEEDEFKIELAKGYLNAISFLGDQNKQELTKHLDELELIADATQDNIELQTIYSQSLLNSLKIIGISDMDKTNDILKEMKQLNNNFPENNTILKNYVESLVGLIGLFAQGQNAEEIIPLVEAFEELDKKYPDEEFVQQTHVMLMEQLKFMGFKKKAKKKSNLGYM